MEWMDFDRNGVVDGTDFFILNEIFNSSGKDDGYDRNNWDEGEEDCEDDYDDDYGDEDDDDELF